MRTKQMVALAVGIALSLAAQAQTTPQTQKAYTALQQRLVLFQKGQLICKGMALSSAQLANNLVGATSASLSSMCECAALLSVSNKSSGEVSSLLTGNADAAAKFSAEIGQNLNRCVQMQSS